MGDDNRGRKGGSAGILLIVFLGLIFYAFYTDEIESTVSTAQTVSEVGNVIQGFKDLLPLSLANSPIEGDTICDLDLLIPTMVSNRALFGSTNADVISDEQGKLMQIANFLNEPQWYYIGIETMDSPTLEWKNCYTQGSLSFASLIPLFNGQIASEKISSLFGVEPEQLSAIDPIVVNPSPVALGSFTQDTSITLSISGVTSDGLILIDKFNRGNFIRTVQVQDGINYPIIDSLRFTIENTKLDNYEISVVSGKPINEKLIGEPYVFSISG